MSNTASSSKRKSPTTSDFDEEAMKKALRMETVNDEKADRKAVNLAELLPTMTKNSNGAISNDALEKLFYALCGDTGKEWDSDDSIISEIDFMDDEVIAEKDRRMKEMFESLPKMDEDIKRLTATLMIGRNESKKDRDARRKQDREEKMGLTTEEEKEAAERKRQRSLERQDERLAKYVNVFEDLKEPGTLHITCSTFSSLLEVMANVVPHDESYKHRKNIKNIDMKEFAKQIRFMGIKCTFYKDECMSTEQFMISAVKRILKSEDVLDILNHKRYGFNFNTRECILTLEKYYMLNRPSASDNGASVKPLAIHMRQLVKAAFHVARQENSAFVVNENLRTVLFD